MAELGLSTSTTTASVSEIGAGEENMEPTVKKKRLDLPQDVGAPSGLEERLNGILCCTVCLDLPNVAMFQVNFFLFSYIILVSVWFVSVRFFYSI